MNDNEDKLWFDMFFIQSSWHLFPPPPQMLDEDAVVADRLPPEGWMPADLPQGPLESVIRDYILLTCFRKDVHKVETFLKLLRCRRTDSATCVAVQRADSPWALGATAPCIRGWLLWSIFPLVFLNSVFVVLHLPLRLFLIFCGEKK